jgi:16S rRNA (guanine527-N7)-methyltransferase
MQSDIISIYFPELTPLQYKQFSMLPELYSEWNSKINVVSRKDIDLLPERHVLHSLGIAKVTKFSAGTSIMDVGTGGGFPGIPLAIMFPECNFLLVDSIGKKIKVVEEVANSLELKNIRTKHDRVENIKEKFEFIVSRAVTDFSEFYNWVKNKFSNKQFNTFENGILYLKGGDLTEELKSFKNKTLVFDLSKQFKEEFFETKRVVYMPV